MNDLPQQLDLERLKSEIRASAARRPPFAGPPAADLAGVAESLRKVEELADLGSAVPELPRFRGVLRVVGRIAARLVLIFSRFLTNRQRDCNHAILIALANLQAALRRQQREHAAELRALRDELARLRHPHNAAA
jgi:hypothetical protein